MFLRCFFLVMFVVCDARVLFCQDANIQGKGGVRSVEERSQNGVSVIRFENIPWIPNLTQVEFSKSCRFKITQPALVVDEDYWIAADPTISWSSISRIVVWSDKLFVKPSITIYGNDGKAIVSKNCGSDRESAESAFAAMALEIKRGHAEIQMENREYWNPLSLFLLAIGNGVLIALVGLGVTFLVSRGDVGLEDKKNGVVGVAFVFSIIIALFAWMFVLSKMTCFTIDLVVGMCSLLLVKLDRVLGVRFF